MLWNAGYCYRCRVEALSVCVSHRWALHVQKQINRSWCRLGSRLASAQGTLYYMGCTLAWWRGDWKRKYGKRKYRRMEYASTEYISTNMQGWKMQVRKTQVRICNGGKRKYSNLKSILKSLRFSSLAVSVDPLSVGLDQFTCTVPDRCYTQEIGLMTDSCAEGPGFKNRRRDAVE